MCMSMWVTCVGVWVVDILVWVCDVCVWFVCAWVGDTGVLESG